LGWITRLHVSLGFKVTRPVEPDWSRFQMLLFPWQMPAAENQPAVKTG
jgi:hypothetical protein